MQLLERNVYWIAAYPEFKYMYELFMDKVLVKMVN